MIDAVRKLAWRLTWRFKAAAARTVVEDYDGAPDALILPFVSGIMTYVSVAAASELVAKGGLAALATAFGIGVFGMVAAGLTAVSLLASLMYATEVTELDTDRWWFAS